MSAERPWAWPLVPLYGAALAVGDALQLVGLPRARRLQWPVLSVGSVSAGGAGKTPVTIALAALLRDRGWTVDVLSRGYRRTGREVERVQPNLADAAARYGDEPVVIAERTGVPVWVGRSRYAAGRLAEEQTARAMETAAARARGKEDGEVPHTAHILDDGMQHRALQRQFEVLVLTARDLRDTLLPAGNLREPLVPALRRAEALVVREEEVDEVAEALHRLRHGQVALWTIRRTLKLPPPLGVFGAGLRPLAFCGLARPGDFAASLAGAGCGVVDTVVFPDHHRYGERDMRTLTRVAEQLRATGLVTTEKDAVKISPEMRARLEADIGPVIVARLETGFVYEAPVVRALEQKFRPPRKTGEPVEAPSR